MQSFHFGEVTVDIRPGLTITTLADGSKVTADHAEQPGQADIAEGLGYSSAEAMNVQHDMLHSLIAHWLGLDGSPTLKGVAAGRHFPRWREEENAVFALAAYANAIGVDLMEVARRYSE
jgi:hypothetical protein